MEATSIDQAEARVEVDCSPAEVWALVSDLTRVGEWSPENRGGTWLDGATAAAPGVRFRGRNRRGLARWSTVSTIVRLEPERAIAWEVRAPWGGAPLSRWTYELSPTATGTAIVERWELLKLDAITRASWVLLAGSVGARREMLRRSLDQSLAKLARVVSPRTVQS